MQPTETDSATVRKGRVLAGVATTVVPFMIVWYGIASGYPSEVVAPALLIWGAGTTMWLRSIWRRLQLTPGTDANPRSGGPR